MRIFSSAADLQAIQAACQAARKQNEPTETSSANDGSEVSAIRQEAKAACAS